MFSKNITLPVSIILIGIIISGGIYISRQEPEIITEDNANIIQIQPISDFDNVLGNPEAKVTIIEYADFACPYCQTFHETMGRITDRYIKTGQVSWVYRHLPVTETHENSYGAAVASECVAEYDKNLFFTYSNLIFNDAPITLEPENLKLLALNLGVEENFYNQCILSNRHNITIDRNIEDAKILAEYEIEFSTPYLIIYSNTGLQTTISGSESYENLVEIIETLLAN